MKYENINYFYDMKNTADYSPPEENSSTLPHNDQRFANLYNRSYESSSYVYKLKPDWEKYANVPVYEAMVEYGYFIPKALSEKIFNEMFTGLGDTSQESFTSEQKSLSSAWDYNKLTQNYNRINNQADWVIKKYICQYTSYEERRELAFYKLYDGRLIPLKNKSLVMNNSRFYSNSIAKITTEDPPENPGIPNLSKGYLLDRLYLEDGTEAARLWLQDNQNVFVEEITAIPEDLKILDVNASSVKINLHNVEISYNLSNFDPVIEEMPEDYYENTVHDIVIGNNKFGFFDFYALTSDIYKQLETIANKDHAELLKASYVFNETDKLWQLKNEITNTNIMVIIGMLQSLYPISTGPFYDTEPNLKNIICLDDEQYNKLINFFKAEEQNIVKTAFNKITVDNINYYLPIQNHQDISLQLSIYFRENIAFPWYEQKDGLRVLKKLEQQEEIQNRKEVLTAFWNILNLGTWKNVIKKVDITSDVKLNVVNSILPDNQSLLEMAIGVENIQPNSEVGKITFPGLNSQGQTMVYQRFIPQFNSTQDFNAMYSQLTKIRKKILAAKSNSTTNYIDDFSGGYMGWEYNTWKSYKDFDPELVGKNKITGKIDDIESKYTLGIQSNQQKKDNEKVITTIINKTGKEYVTELDTNTWIGEISSYNVPTLQSDGTNLNIEYTFAPYIKADEMAPCRKGGDFIHETFQGSSSASKNTLTLLNKSLNDSNEVTLGLGGLYGGNVSINSSTSIQYIGLTDFNGDHYPDMLNTPTDHGESKTFMAGSKKGLTNNQTITVPFDNLNRFSNLTAGFGITGSTGSMAIAVKTDADGKEIASNIVQGLGNSWSLSTSGTMSQGIQTNSLMDINGDGLPDYLSRNNLEDISVKINTGIGNTWSNASWTNVMNEELADWRYNLTDGYIFSSHSSGLSYSNNGSIGGRINYTLPGFNLVTYTLTAGAGIGITANNNKTSYRLVDVNSDGLPDQVAKAADSKYFMVKFNLGDTFSDKIVKLYRPDWGVKDATLLNYIAESIPKLLGNFTGATVNGNSQQNNETPVLQNNTNDGPFSQAVRPLEIEDTLDYSTGISLSLGGNARFQWDLGFSGLELT
ncbi:MAG: hypothetical protein JXR70_17070, partial [Spirochaetales bacterium]|nr:hypothetical protein [Spirochaetales bacterium]